MDGGRFDGLARALASSKTRRGYLVAALGVLGAAALAVRGSTGAGQVGCQAEGEPCAFSSFCCSGHFCERTSLYNPNVGVCRRGADPTSSGGGSRTRTPDRRTQTPQPTRTAKPTKTPKPPKPTATPDPSPLQGELNCTPLAGQPQVLLLRNEGTETLFVTSITPIQQLPTGCTPVVSTRGFRIRASRSNRRRQFRFGCLPPPSAGGHQSCVTTCLLFEPRDNTNGAVVRFRGRNGSGSLTVRCP